MEAKEGMGKAFQVYLGAWEGTQAEDIAVGDPGDIQVEDTAVEAMTDIQAMVTAVLV